MQLISEGSKQIKIKKTGDEKQATGDGRREPGNMTGDIFINIFTILNEKHLIKETCNSAKQSEVILLSNSK